MSNMIGALIALSILVLGIAVVAVNRVGVGRYQVAVHPQQQAAYLVDTATGQTWHAVTGGPWEQSGYRYKPSEGSR